MSYAFYTTKEYTDVTAIDTIDVTTTGTIQWVIKIDGTYYHHSTSWIESDITFAQSTTDTNFNSNAASLPLNAINGSTVQLIAIEEYIGVAVGISKFKINMEQVDNVDAVGTNIVVDVSGVNNESGANVKITAALQNFTGNNPVYMGRFINPTTITAYTNNEGKATLNLMPNVSINPSGTYWSIQIGELTTKNYNIPADLWSKELDELTPM